MFQSSGFQLQDTNDFISPSQACIKPVETLNNISKNDGKAQVFIYIHPIDYYLKISITIDDSGNYFEENEKLETAQITLNDCLACSGCITSAESILVASQSHLELEKALLRKKESLESGKDKIVIVVSISPQSRASIAVKHDLSLNETHTIITQVLKSWGVDYVFDTSFSRDFSLIESAKEFVERYKTSNNPTSSAQLPMLSGICPGWICYAEKTHGNLVPLIDTTKSPQQIMGSLIKDSLSIELSMKQSQIYHVTIMPCYDKKLESSRKEFLIHPDSVLKDVDCVITTGELDLIMNKRKINLLDFQPSICVESLYTKCEKIDMESISLMGSSGSSSGGYIDYIMKFAAKELFNIDLLLAEIEFGSNNVKLVQGKNQDIQDIILLNDQGDILLKFAKVYGFRNIQNLVRKLNLDQKSKSKSGYHFVEVMACPSGCINGGGQLKQMDSKWSSSETSSNSLSRQFVAISESKYRSIKTQGPLENLAVLDLYRKLIINCLILNDT